MSGEDAKGTEDYTKLEIAFQKQLIELIECKSQLFALNNKLLESQHLEALAKLEMLETKLR